MLSNRREVQKWWEHKLGCSDSNNWHHHKSAVEAISLNILDIPNLSNLATIDRMNYGFNAIVSFLEGVKSIKERHFAWGIIKLYYSVFYALRYEILSSDHILIRCKGLYLMKLDDGENFKKINGNKKSGDHQLTIKAEDDLVKRGDISDAILDNELEGKSPYLWLMDQRERVNYYQASFSDPDCDECIQRPYEDYFLENKIDSLFELYSDDTNLVYAFDKEHSMIAIPFYRIKRIMETMSWDKVNLKRMQHIYSLYLNIITN